MGVLLSLEERQVETPQGEPSPAPPGCARHQARHYKAAPGLEVTEGTLEITQPKWKHLHPNLPEQVSFQFHQALHSAS